MLEGNEINHKVYPFDANKYEKVVTAAIKRKHAGIATQQDIALIELFDTAFCCHADAEHLAGVARLYNQYTELSDSRNLKFLSGDTYVNEDMKILLENIKKGK